MMQRSQTFRVWALGALAHLVFALGTLGAQTPAQGAQGRVLNGTTQKPVPNVEVQYVKMMQGMAPAAKATTDREGRFQFQEIPGGSAAPALLRVEYQGATYSHPMMPGQSQAEGIQIQVFEASSDLKLIAVKEQAIFLHPTGETMVVLEQIILENRSSPPRTYVNPQGTYPFTLPKSASQGVKVTVQGPEGMPINQTPVSGEKENSYAVTYPIRPGETQFRVEYSLGYQPPFEFSKPIDLPAEQMHLITPGKEVELKGESLEAMPPDPTTGFVGYRVTSVGKAVRVQVSGQAPVQSGAQSAAESEGGGSLTPIPAPVHQQRWLVLAVAGLVMLGGFVYLYTR